jgi:hypothetical protein
VSSGKVEIIAPNFGLQKKLGAPAKHMPSQKLQSADAALEKLANGFDVLRAHFLETLKSSQSTCEEIYLTAHEFRGLAGSFQRKPQGKIADALCRYVDAARDNGHTPDTSVVNILKNALLACETVSVNDPYACEKISEAACEAALKKIEDLKKS